MTVQDELTLESDLITLSPLGPSYLLSTRMKKKCLDAVRQSHNLKFSFDCMYFKIQNSPFPLTFPEVNLMAVTNVI